MAFDLASFLAPTRMKIVVALALFVLSVPVLFDDASGSSHSGKSGIGLTVFYAVLCFLADPSGATLSGYRLIPPHYFIYPAILCCFAACVFAYFFAPKPVPRARKK